MTQQSRAQIGAWLGVVPFFLFVTAFMFWPTAASLCRRLPRPCRQFHPRRSRGSLSAFHLGSLLAHHPREFSDGHRRRSLWLPISLCRDHGWIAPGRARHCDHLFRCGLELCRHSAGLCLYRHPGPRRLTHRHPQEHGHRPLSRRLQPLWLLGIEPHLSLFSAAADGLDYRPGARWVEAASGAKPPTTWARRTGNTGAWWRCPSCCRRCWGR